MAGLALIDGRPMTRCRAMSGSRARSSRGVPDISRQKKSPTPVAGRGPHCPRILLPTPQRIGSPQYHRDSIIVKCHSQKNLAGHGETRRATGRCACAGHTPFRETKPLGEHGPTSDAATGVHAPSTGRLWPRHPSSRQEPPRPIHRNTETPHSWSHRSPALSS